MMLIPLPRSGALGQQFIDIREERSSAILHILDAGWEMVSESPEVHAGVDEVKITGHLRSGMRMALSAKVSPWCKKMTVLPGTESRSSTDLSKPDGLTDIPIFFQDIREEYDEHDPHAIIECKRVAGDDAKLCRLYTTNGVDRFKSGKYGSHHTVGFMAGYLTSGTTSAAVTGINAYLTRKGRCSEHLMGCNIHSVPWARTSHHRRPNSGNLFILHHAFFGLQPALP